MKKLPRPIKKIFLYCIIWGLFAWCAYSIAHPKITIKTYDLKTYDLTEESAVALIQEDNRQCGWINLEKFKALARAKGVIGLNVLRRQGEVVISFDAEGTDVNNSCFFGADDGKWWREQRYKDLPISFPDENSFKAKINRDSTEYIYIPYEILKNLANYRGAKQP